MSSTIRVAMLNADSPVPNVISRFETYGHMFHELLVAAASRIHPDVRIESTYHDVVQMQYPESLADSDVVLITGSAASAYDDVEWIRRLDGYVSDVYTRHPHVKIFGSCFGHQLVCQSLLRPYGVRVEKDPNGWELGVKEIEVEDGFRKALGKGTQSHSNSQECDGIPETMRVQFIHADHVRIPSLDSLPDSWLMMGQTKHCAVQGAYEPGRVLTMQGHFEFDLWINTEIIEVFGATWKEDVLEQVLNSIDADDDSEAAAEMVIRFLLEKGSNRMYKVADGLLTPPRDNMQD